MLMEIYHIIQNSKVLIFIWRTGFWCSYGEQDSERKTLTKLELINHALITKRNGMSYGLYIVLYIIYAAVKHGFQNQTAVETIIESFFFRKYTYPIQCVPLWHNEPLDRFWIEIASSSVANVGAHPNQILSLFFMRWIFATINFPLGAICSHRQSQV